MVAPAARSQSAARSPQQLLHRDVVGVEPAAEPGNRHAQAVGHRGVEPDAGVGRGHLLHGTDHPLHSRQQAPQALLGRQPVQPDQAGVPEIAEGADRRRNELVRDHAAAHQTVVAVPEVVGGDRRTWSHQIVDHVVEDSDRPAVQVPLQVAADLVL